MAGGGGGKAGFPKSGEEVMQTTGVQPEIATRNPTHATLTDIIDENRGNLPAARYPRSSFENQTNRFYVKDPATAGDMRAEIVKGEKFTNEPGSGNKYDTGEVWDRGDTGGSPRANDTTTGI